MESAHCLFSLQQGTHEGAVAAFSGIPGLDLPLRIQTGYYKPHDPERLRHGKSHEQQHRSAFVALGRRIGFRADSIFHGRGPNPHETPLAGPAHATKSDGRAFRPTITLLPLPIDPSPNPTQTLAGTHTSIGLVPEPECRRPSVSFVQRCRQRRSLEKFRSLTRPNPSDGCPLRHRAAPVGARRCLSLET